VRLNKDESFEFVAEWVYALAGTFDGHGNMWVSLGNFAKGHYELARISDVASLPGYANYKVVPNWRNNPPNNLYLTPWYGSAGDLAVVADVEANYDGSSQALYVIGFGLQDDNKPMVLLHNTNTAVTYEIPVDGPKGLYGSAWTYANQATFANNGGGVYLVVVNNISDASLIKVGESGPFRSNDGFNCVAPPGETPFRTCGHKDGYPSSPVTNAECASAAAPGWIYDSESAHIICPISGCGLACCKFDPNEISV